MLMREITQAELAEKLHTTQPNLSNKFKRDNFSDKELQDIAEVMNCTFEGVFTLNDTQEKV